MFVAGDLKLFYSCWGKWTEIGIRIMTALYNFIA